MKYYLAFSIKWFPLAVHVALLVTGYVLGLLEVIKGNPMSISADIFWCTNSVLLIILILIIGYKVHNWVDETLKERR